MISEQKFRQLCRSEQGGIESERFAKALIDNDMDPVPVVFDVGLDETRTVDVPRDEAEAYARIAKEERQPEEDLLRHIKPDAHLFIRHNRGKVVEKLKETMLQSRNGNLTLIWPLWTPDSVPVDVAEKYLKRYGG